MFIGTKIDTENNEFISVPFGRIANSSESYLEIEIRHIVDILKHCLIVYLVPKSMGKIIRNFPSATLGEEKIWFFSFDTK